MCNLSDAGEGREKPEGPDEQNLEVAYHLVPGLETYRNELAQDARSGK
jgi:hypothetical protein